MENLSKPIDSLAPGCDGVSTDLIKHCKTILLLPLYEVLCQCWQEGTVPQDMGDAKIITLYTNKGQRRVCNNYRVISLLSIVGKIFARIFLVCLQKLPEHVYTASEVKGQRYRWSSAFANSRRGTENKRCPCSSLSLTSPKHLIWSAETRFSESLPSIIESFHTNMKGQCSSTAAPRGHSTSAGGEVS